MTVFCEILTVRIWLGSVLPFFVRRQFGTGPTPRVCYFVDASTLARVVAQWTGGLIGITVRRFVFHLVDVRDADGQLIRLRVAYHDIAEAQDAAVSDETFRAFVDASGLDEIELEYLAKCVGAISLTDRTTMWRALLLVQIVAWRMASEPVGRAVLFLERRPWHAVLSKYAEKAGVLLRVVTPVFRPSTAVRSWLRPGRLARMRAWRDVIKHVLFLSRQGVSMAQAVKQTTTRDALLPGGPRIAVEYLGQFNLNEPGYYSDLFFWQESSLEGRRIVLTFGMPQDPVDEGKLAQLQDHGMAAVALYPGASTVASVPIFIHTPNWRRRHHPSCRAVGDVEWNWMREKLEAYDVLHDYWTALFSALEARVYVTWYRVDERIYPISSAMRRLGGVTAIYQRSFQIDPSPETAIDVELAFGFSRLDAEVERQSGSRIGYHVAVGYTADHRVGYAQPLAQQIRDSLLKCGARSIVAYFDENSNDDSRWHTGHEFMRENYQFVLERLLADPSLGLVLKPKRPSSLRRRLGPVSELLERALATGRCHLSEAGPLHGSDPPVVAALAADLVVHGHLCATTAGIESALAGVPTLLLDREGWPRSPMYELGVGRVVFTNWTDLWSASREHLSRPGGVDGFGDWQPLIEQLDPFRDGRAAERMGTYLEWIIEGLRGGQTSESVLAIAAERYAAAWGSDKVCRVDGRRAAGPVDRRPPPSLPLAVATSRGTH